jgi:hypothetical protein
MIVIGDDQLAMLGREIDRRLTRLWAAAAARSHELLAAEQHAMRAAAGGPDALRAVVEGAVAQGRALGIDAASDLVLWPAMALAGPFAGDWPEQLDHLPGVTAADIAAMRRAGLQWRVAEEAASARAWSLAARMLEASS